QHSKTASPSKRTPSSKPKPQNNSPSPKSPKSSTATKSQSPPSSTAKPKPPPKMSTLSPASSASTKQNWKLNWRDTRSGEPQWICPPRNR
ncbi:MAG: hypothetical protein Q9174_007401, partial [Haloplaca sp. 1 TL-2023]